MKTEKVIETLEAATEELENIIETLGCQFDLDPSVRKTANEAREMLNVIADEGAAEMLGRSVMERHSGTFEALAASEREDKLKELLGIFVRAADGEEIPEMEWGYVLGEAKKAIK